MNDIKQWFKEAEKKLKVFKFENDIFILYKGFKITNLKNKYFIQDVRYSNVYSPPSLINLKCFQEFGFIKGADIISYNNNIKKIKRYKSKMEILYEKRKKFKKEMHKDRRLNTKRIRNINKHIDEYADLVFLYQSKVNDFNDKYK